MTDNDKRIQLLIILSLFAGVLFAISFWKSILVEGILVGILTLDVYLWFRKVSILMQLLFSQAHGEITSIAAMNALLKNSDQAFTIFVEICFFTGKTFKQKKRR